jgi:hypothetical protein
MGRILDNRIVIDAWLPVSLVGIELLAIKVRIVIASVETYLKYAEAVRLEIRIKYDLQVLVRSITLKAFCTGNMGVNEFSFLILIFVV